ncbi:hypothetical protein [Absidia glauca]|uniref:RRM domain-containing protein n=1 Tax=Absidia glauca TaxID=4829 RepID=A0A168PUG5_ABSGL|nr:hypothetical protein [Absidia glauca]
MTPSPSDNHTTQDSSSSSPTQEDTSTLSRHYHSDNLQAFRSDTDDRHDEIVNEQEPVPDEHPAHPKTQVRQLFVGNLPFRMRWQDLKDLFRKAGQVLRADVALSVDHRSKGHGTVLFATVEDAQAAIDMLHNSKWHGRVLEVREDRGYVEQQPLKQHSSSSTVSSPWKPEDNQQPHGMMKPEPTKIIQPGRQLFVGNLPFQCQWQDLKDLFRRAGKILRADVAQEADGRSRGFGTVLFATLEDGKKAIEMLNGFEYQGRQLRVHFDKFAAGTPHHHQQQRTTHDYLLPSRFGNIEFNSQSPDPNVLESLQQTYGSNFNSNSMIGSYCAISTGQPSYAPTSVDLTYDHYHPSSQQGSRYDPPLAHHYQRQQPLMPARSERDSPYFGYYSSPLISQSLQEMSQHHSTSSVGTEGDATQSLFRYSSHWSPHEQPPSLYSSYQQQNYDFYRPPASHQQQDELSQSMQQMKLVGEEGGESRNGFGAADGKNGNSATTRGVWDPLNRLRL